MTQNRTGTALIGYGIGGKIFHAPLIAAEPRLDLLAIVSRRRETIEHDWPQVRAVEEVESIWRDPAIELVVIATPNDSHAELAAAALRAGKHVIVDKPFTLNAASAQQLIELAQSRQRQLSVFHNRRWDQDYLALSHALKAGQLGEVFHYEARFDRFRPQPKPGWRESAADGAGMLYDLGAHLIDQALHLFGLPAAVTADIAVQREGAQVEDWFQLDLNYGRRRVLLGASCLMAAPGPHFAVHGTQGSLLTYGLDRQEAALNDGLHPGAPEWNERIRLRQASLSDAQGISTPLPTPTDDYAAYYRGIAASLHDGAPLPVTAEQARDVIRVIEAAHESSRTQRRVNLSAP